MPLATAQDLLPADRGLAWAVFALLLAAYLATFSGLPENPDSEVEFQTASALARRGSFALGGTSEADAIVGIVHQGRQGFNVRRGGRGREQEFFSWSGVGQALVAVPFYAAGALAGRLFPALEERHRATTHLGVARSEYAAHLAVGLRNPLLGALTGALLVIAARRAGARRSFAVLCALTYGLCTYAWPQARGTLSDVQATAMLFLAFVLAQGATRSLESGRRPRAVGLAGFGLALGTAFLTRPVLAPGVAVLALFFAGQVVRAGRADPAAHAGGGAPPPLRELALGLLPALGCFALFLWTNESRFGDPLETGYGGVVGLDWFLRAPWEGLVGVTVSWGSGLLWFAPGVVLALPWLVRALRSRRRDERALAVLVAGMGLAVGLPHALIPSWHGAWSYGPRYLLPLIPFLWLPLGLVLEELWPRLAWRLAACALFLLGATTALGGALVEYNTNLDLTLQAARLEWPDRPGVDPLVQDDERFVRAKFDPRFAAPWAHWRILLHRLAGRGERYAARELYSVDGDTLLEPQWPREKGFAHIAWVDLAQRLDGPGWIGIAPCGLLALLAAALVRRARRLAELESAP